MQWFHRNPLKASSKLDFDLGLVIKSVNARKLASDTTNRRARLLSMLSDPNIDLEMLLQQLQSYISSVYGFIYEYSEDGSKNDSKIRFTKHIRWSNSTDLKGAEPQTHADFMFEWASMLMNVAIWFSKKAAKLSAVDNITEEDAKKVHKCLKYASGLMKMCQEDLFPKITVELPKESDGDPNIIEAYIYQFNAEAQEIVMAQAIEKGHLPSLIAKLAFNTSETYDRARLCLHDYPLNKVGKWKLYCLFKQLCYSAYAHSYHVMTLLGDGKGGEAIACAKKAQSMYSQSIQAAKDYSKSPGVGLTVRPAEHLFFRNLEPLIERNLRRATDENTMIYHQKVPDSFGELNMTTEFGLTKPELPPVEFKWAEEWKTALDGFDSSRTLANIVEEQKKSKENKTKVAAEAPLMENHEKPIYDTDKDPSTKSGCVIS